MSPPLVLGVFEVYLVNGLVLLYPMEVQPPTPLGMPCPPSTVKALLANPLRWSFFLVDLLRSTAQIQINQRQCWPETTFLSYQFFFCFSAFAVQLTTVNVARLIGQKKKQKKKS